MKFIAPLKVKKSKLKYFQLNMNNYRNAHYMVLNNTKREFSRIMDERYPEKIKPLQMQIRTEYVIYCQTKIKFDIGNVGSIVQKYFEDWLVGRGVIPDDNITVIPSCEYNFGGVDKDDPRAEIFVGGKRGGYYDV